jgi:molybdate transport system permease protein
MEFITPLLLSFKLAFFTTLILLFLGTALAFWLSETTSPSRHLVAALVNMPLVLPPTVLGFYFLLLFSPNHQPGRFFQEFLNTRLAFSFEGLLVASVVFNFPFMVNPVYSGLVNLPRSLKEASYTLGKSRFTTFRRVLLPNTRSSFVTACALSFAHTVGEFGVVIMVGGNIPGETRVASIAIYNEVEAMHYRSAHMYSLILTAMTFIILMAMQYFNRKEKGFRFIENYEEND